MTTNIEHFVTADAVADFLGVSREHVLDLARAGKIPAHPLPTGNRRLRRTWRFRLSEISAHVEQSR